MSGSGVKGLSIFLGFILSPAGILGHTLSSERPTKIHRVFFLNVHSGGLSGLLPQVGGGVHMEGSIETQ